MFHDLQLTTNSKQAWESQSNHKSTDPLVIVWSWLSGSRNKVWFLIKDDALEKEKNSIFIYNIY